MRIATPVNRSLVRNDRDFCKGCGAWQAGDRKGRPYGELQEVRWGGTMWASSPTEAYLAVRRGGALPLPRAG